ncbi:MAG: FtsX-like permease family protein [Planctomycetia bacterium]|nr:FtsX-like permease family protein [Planctomycetia bacterium]
MRDHQAGDEAPDRPDMAQAGWAHRRRWVERQRMIESMQPRADREDAPVDPFRSDAALPAESTDPLVPVTDATPDATWPARASAAPRHAAADEPRANPSEPAAWASSPTGEEESGNPFRGLPVATPGLPADRPPREPVDQLQPDASSVHAATAAVEQAQERAPAADAAAAADLVAAGESAGAVKDPFDARPREEDVFDPASEQHDGLVLGMALASYRDQQGRDRFLALPGDDVKLSFPTAGTPPDVCHASFTIVDFYESKMSEYDASFVFVPIRTLQKLRGMFDPTTGIGYATSIQIKLRPGADGDAVRDMLRANFMPQLYNVSTWRDKQGPLLAAVQLETAILNLLLFLIIAVAGFGILAIFFMIVVEKTRDIGILKSLGASGRGILGIFLGYGLSLGLVGAGAGLAIGLLFIAYINEIADVLGLITGHEVFDPSIYYFLKIPTIVDPATVAWIVTGALAIAVLASVLPARRAARLHPVEALRYE